ncbi:hypothetical protein HN51_048997 [Arachis hypogaea]
MLSDTGKNFSQGRIIETNLSTTVKYTWTIWNFSALECYQKYSDTFFTGNHPWRISLYPQGFRPNYLSIYLTTGDNSFLPAGSWNKTVNFKLTLKNLFFTDKDITRGTKYEYGSAKYPGYGFSSFITLTEFLDPNNGFLVNDSCSIEAEVCVVNDGHQHHPNDNRIVPLVTRNNDNNNLVDFKGLCKVKKDFVPLLEEACSKHPELVEGQKKRNQSEKFTENSFMTLGRVLHFLKSHKDVKDCTDDCVKEFQNLWKELESSGFDDLTWLENDVKNYTVKKLNENVDLQGEKGELLKVD